MTLAEVATELYGLPPAQFTAARTARVKALRAAGDRELAGRVQTLRRPTLAAWGVNLLVRHRPADVEALLTLGGRLLQAQAAGAGDDLRELDRSRHAAMATLREEAHRLADAAGQRLGETADVPLESTLRAAMADAAAAAAVRSGLLVRDLVGTGFGPVDVGDAVAVPDAPPLTGAHPAPPAPPAEDDDAPEVALPRRSRTAGHPSGPTGRTPDGEAPGAAGTGASPARRRSPGGDPAGGAGPRGAGASGAGASGAGARGAEARGAAASGAEAVSRERDDRAEADRAARRRRREQARADLDAAQARADASDRHLAAARATADDLTRQRAELDAEVARLAAALADAEDRQRRAAVAERRARAAQDAASKDAAAAARRVGAARERLEGLDD